MNKDEIKFTDVIHCKTEAEFNRIIDLFKMDDEYIPWSIYEENTVLYPFDNQYGEVDGYAKEEKFNVVDSEEVE